MADLVDGVSLDYAGHYTKRIFNMDEPAASTADWLSEDLLGPMRDRELNEFVNIRRRVGDSWHQRAQHRVGPQSAAVGLDQSGHPFADCGGIRLEDGHDILLRRQSGHGKPDKDSIAIFLDETK